MNNQNIYVLQKSLLIPYWVVPILGLALLALICFFLSKSHRFGMKRAIFCLSIVAATIVFATALNWVALVSQLFNAYILFLLVYAYSVKKDNTFPIHKKHLVAFTVIGILLLSFILRCDRLLTMQNSPLDPDAITYRILALKATHFFDSDFREPLFVFLIKLYIKVFGNEASTLRYLTVFLSIISIYLTYVVGRGMFRLYFIGLASAFLMAINSYLIFMSVHLLRLELFIICILLLFYYLFVRKGDTIQRHILVGISGAACSLTRITSLSFVIPFILFSAWRNKSSISKCLLSIAITIIIVLPHFVNNKRKFGSYTYSVDIHAKWYRNYEFKDKPGFPTSKELEKNSYAGSPVTSYQYIFGLHSLGTVFKRSVKGFFKIFFQRRFFGHNYLLFCLYLLGLCSILMTEQRFLVGTMIFMIGPTAFLVGTLAIDKRLVMHLYPFKAFITSYFMVTAAKYLYSRVGLKNMLKSHFFQSQMGKGT